MALWSAVTLAALARFAAKALAWLIQRRRGNAGIVDGIWAWALGGLAAWFAWVGSAPAAVRWQLATMGLLWGLRLGTHLWRRNWRSPEDWRYAAFRTRWGAQAQFKMFWFFQFQNLFTLGLACCAYLPAAYRPGTPPGAAMLLAGLIWAVAVIGETLADAQLRAFVTNPAHHGQVCERGLWRYSRHPNYFFECLHWVAYVPLAWGSPWLFASLLAPLIMAALVLKISGIPLLEGRLAQTRQGYADYMRRTNRLVPGPRRL